MYESMTSLEVMTEARRERAEAERQTLLATEAANMVALLRSYLLTYPLAEISDVTSDLLDRIGENPNT